MRYPFKLLILFCAVCVIAGVAGNVESVKRSDTAAKINNENPLASPAVPTQEAGEFDPRIRKVGDLPEEIPEYGGYQLQFINEQEGWLGVCSRSEFNAEKKDWDSSGRLWRTRDGGKSWALIYADSVKPLYQFQFISAETGWMRVSDDVYKTTDGGSTWVPFRQPIPPLFKGELIQFNFLNDGQHGWVIGGIFKPYTEEKAGYAPSRYLSSDGKHCEHGAIFQTTDGGETWEEKYVSKWSGFIDDLCLTTPHSGVAVGTAGIVYLKNDRWKQTLSDGADDGRAGGVNSLTIEIGMPTFQPCSLFMLDESIGWLSNNSGYMAKTTDGGRTWHDILDAHDILPIREALPFPCFSDLYFKDRLHGFALEGGDDGPLYETKDGGFSWTSINGGAAFSSSFFLDSQHGWLINRRELYHFTP